MLNDTESEKLEDFTVCKSCGDEIRGADLQIDKNLCSSCRADKFKRKIKGWSGKNYD